MNNKTNNLYTSIKWDDFSILIGKNVQKYERIIRFLSVNSLTNEQFSKLSAEIILQNKHKVNI